MNRNEFITAARRDGLSLATLYAECLGIRRAVIDLWIAQYQSN